jgi:hypothetical protein
MPTRNGPNTLMAARRGLAEAERKRDAATKGSVEYRVAVRQVGQRWSRLRRLELAASLDRVVRVERAED